MKSSLVLVLLILARPSFASDSLSGILLFSPNESIVHQETRWAIHDFETGKTAALPWAKGNWAALSPDGRQIVFSTPEKNEKQTIRFGSWRQEKFESATFPQWYVREMSWDNTGNKIFLDYGAYDISLGTYTRYSVPDKTQIRPAPDGQKRALFYYSDPVNIEIVSGEDRIKLPPASELPAWSRQSDAIAYAREGELVVYDLASKSERQLTSFKSASEFVAKPTFSPDGKKIAFCLAHKKDIPRYLIGAYSSIFVINRDGTGLRKLFSGCDPSWGAKS